MWLQLWLQDEARDRALESDWAEFHILPIDSNIRRTLENESHQQLMGFLGLQPPATPGGAWFIPSSMTPSVLERAAHALDDIVQHFPPAPQTPPHMGSPSVPLEPPTPPLETLLAARPSSSSSSSSDRPHARSRRPHHRATRRSLSLPPGPDPSQPKASSTPPSATSQATPSSSQSHRRRRANEARKLQRWYRANKKRCMRTVLGEQSPACEIPTATLHDHFDQPAVSLGPETPEWLTSPTPPPNSSDELTITIAAEEVEAQLKRLPWQSSPGPDGLAYSVWKATPSSPSILAAIYNTCLLNCRFPSSWKKSNTILLYKKGDRSSPRNWRPISLQPTIYKVFAAVMSRRLAAWAKRTGKISASQKGFLPMEGCLEHSFLLESVMADAKRRRKDVRVLWLDLRNAFGSVSHELLWLMMSRLDVPADFISICREVYTGSSQRLRSSEGYTEEIPLRVGIKQGCPLSPLLFNLALEALLPVLETTSAGHRLENDSTIQQMAYADDLCLVATTKEEIESSLAVISAFSRWSGLSLNAQKCGCLSVINSTSRGRYVEPFSPSYCDETIPALEWGDTYRYLGIEVGRTRTTTASKLHDAIIATVEKILASRLTDWQKVDAVNTFALSKATFLLSTSALNRTWAAKVDSTVRKLVKKALRFPTRTISSFFHLPASMGGLGLHSLEDNLESSMVVRALKCLCSRDRLVSNTAWDQLRATILKRTGNPPSTFQDAVDFLSSPPLRNEAARGDVSSLWSLVRKSFRYLGVQVGVGDDSTFVLEFEGSAAVTNHPRSIPALLKKAKEKRRLQQVLASPDQGRSFPLLSLHPASNHWITTGNYIAFAEYKFALRARLNLLPVGTVAKRLRRVENDSCRKCGALHETLGHVLNACTPNVGLMRARHNAILQRLVRAIPTEGKDLFVENSFSPNDQRPDIVLRDQATGRTVVVDVTVTYEGGPEAFNKSRAEKLQKYESLRLWFDSQEGHQDTTVHAFVLGSLGGWDPDNRGCLRALGVGQRYSELFAKLCSVDAIKGSFGIWNARRGSRAASRRNATASTTATTAPSITEATS